MHHPNLNASPINPIPPIILALVFAIAIIEAAFQLGAAGFVGGPAAVGWRLTAFQNFGFFDPLFDWMRQNNALPPDGVYRFVTYPLLHISAMHAVFACVMLLAIGKFVAERFKSLSVLTIFALSSIIAAGFYSLVLDTRQPLLGAYPGIYGLLGAFTWILFMSYEKVGENRLKAFQLIALLLGLQLLFGAIGGNGGMEWVADLTGFVIGFLLSFALAPGGAARLRDWLDTLRNR